MASRARLSRNLNTTTEKADRAEKRRGIRFDKITTKKKTCNAMLLIEVQTTSQDNIPDSLPEKYMQTASQAL